MRPIRAIRSTIAMGSFFSVGCLLPIVFLGVVLANLTILFREMGWPLWIVWAIVVLSFLGLDALLYLAYIVGIIAGFFYKGVWPWSLLAIGSVAVAYLIWWALILLGAVAQPKDEPESEFDSSTEDTDQPGSIENILNEDFVKTKDIHKYLCSLSNGETNIPSDSENEDYPTSTESIFDDEEIRPEAKALACETASCHNSTTSKMSGSLWKPFLVIIALIIAGVLSSSIRHYWKVKQADEKNQAEKAIDEIQECLSDIVTKSTNSEGFPQPIEEMIDTNPKTKGEWGEVERFLKEFMAQVIRQRNNYLSELTDSGLEQLLDADRIEKDDRFIESKNILRNTKLIVTKYRNHTDDLIQNSRYRIEILNLKPSSKINIRKDFDQAINQIRGQLNRTWDLEEKAVEEMEKIILLLESRKGAWEVTNGQFLFDSSKDLDRFNSYLASIDRIVKEQKEIQRKQTEKGIQELNSARAEIRRENEPYRFDPPTMIKKNVTSNRPIHQKPAKATKIKNLSKDASEDIKVKRVIEQNDNSQKKTATNVLTGRKVGHVSNVSDDLIQVNLGLTHGITKGMKLILYRKDKFVGVMEVKIVQKTASVGKITQTNLEPRVGDGVVDRLD